MLPTTILVKKLRTLIIARLLIVTFLLLYAQFVFPAERLVFYSIIAVSLCLSILFVLWLISSRKLRLLGYVQLFWDLILESALVYYTGGVDSIFATVYILSILSAGVILSPANSFLVAGGSSICFVSTIFLNNLLNLFHIRLPSAQTIGRQDFMYMFYASYVWITVFFLVAVLTYYFSRRIQNLEDKMKTQERLVFLGEVVSNIAHEIRNPLASISGSVELLSKQLEAELSEKQRKLMSAVVEESERINRLFNRLLDYSRLSDLHFEEISVASFLDEIFLLMRNQESFNPRVKIKNLCKGKKIKMKVDPEYMKQVLINVITNAFEAMPDGGTLKVDSHMNRTLITIVVEDTGCGMDRKTLNSLFIPFNTTKANGTGLGLAHAYKIVSQHSGQIAVRSKKGKGTRIEVIVPKV